MSAIAIHVENLSKQYRLGQRERYKSLREVLAQGAAARLQRLRSAFQAGSPAETIWALKDVSFDVQQGEVVGIIGRNGAGKSTLLKILSRITKPTRGWAEIHGRVGSLLEVGTGFHPELTGRENIYLNGAILGMKRVEIDRKFDEIVDFAEIEKFLDTPVKRYSSGMYVRLAFAVAAHLEPEILLVDEVLAVGDAAFQKKCLGKMGEVAQGGRTVLFVSHNMGAIKKLCQNAILLRNGIADRKDITEVVVNQYLSTTYQKASLAKTDFIGTLTDLITFKNIQINGNDISKPVLISPSQKINIAVNGECYQKVSDFRITFSVFSNGFRIFSLHDVDTPTTLYGPFKSEITIPEYLLRPGDFELAIGGYRDGMTDWIWGKNLAAFTIMEEWDDELDPINIGIINIKDAFRRRTA